MDHWMVGWNRESLKDDTNPPGDLPPEISGCVPPLGEVLSQGISR